MDMKFSASLMAHMLIELHREFSSHLSALVKAGPDVVISYKAVCFDSSNLHIIEPSRVCFFF